MNKIVCNLCIYFETEAFSRVYLIESESSRQGMKTTGSKGYITRVLCHLTPRIVIHSLMVQYQSSHDVIKLVMLLHLLYPIEVAVQYSVINREARVLVKGSKIGRVCLSRQGGASICGAACWPLFSIWMAPVSI